MRSDRLAQRLWNLRQIWLEIYQHAKPWAYDFSRFTDFQLRDALLQLFAAGELRIWQLTEGWGQPPEDNGIGEGGLVMSGSSAARSIKKKVLQPGGAAESHDAAKEALSSHVNDDAEKAITFDDIVSNPGCRKILYAKYGIVLGPYKELQKIKMPGYQREHGVPHSCFMEGSVASGESRANVPIGAAFGTYNEGDAITYFVFDDQCKGAEHRYLTDVEKSYAKSLSDAGEYATVTKWLDHMEKATAASLCMDTIERAPGVYEARIPEEEGAWRPKLYV